MPINFTIRINNIFISQITTFRYFYRKRKICCLNSCSAINSCTLKLVKYNILRCYSTISACRSRSYQSVCIVVYLYQCTRNRCAIFFVTSILNEKYTIKGGNLPPTCCQLIITSFHDVITFRITVS